jgi:hypothetical protein
MRDDSLPPVNHDDGPRFDLTNPATYDFTMKSEMPSRVNVVKEVLLKDCVKMMLKVSELKSDPHLTLKEVLEGEDEPIIVGEDGVVLFGKATFTKWALLGKSETIEVYVYPLARLSWSDWNRTYQQIAS